MDSLPDEKPVWNPSYGTLDNPYAPDAVSSHRWCTRCNKETEYVLWATSAITTMWECNICGTSGASDPDGFFEPDPDNDLVHS